MQKIEYYNEEFSYCQGKDCKKRTREAPKTMGSRRRIISCLVWGSSRLMESFHNTSDGMANKSARHTHYLKPNSKRVPRLRSFVPSARANHCFQLNRRRGGLANTNQEKLGSQP